MTLIGFIWLFISMVFFGFGEYFYKRFGDTGLAKYAMTGILGSVLSGLTWLPAMRISKTLTVVGLIWSLLSVLTTFGIGVIVFKEHITMLKLIGFLLAIAAITLLSIG